MATDCNRRVLAVGLVAALSTVPTYGEGPLFKCQTPGGRVIYQQEQCKPGERMRTLDTRQLGETETSQLKAGVVAYEKRDISTAVALLIPLAEKRIPEAQYYAANLYILPGSGVPVDPVKALRLMQAAADSGFEPAQVGIVGFEWVLFGYNIGEIRTKLPDSEIRREIWKRSKTAFLFKPCERNLIIIIQQFVDANPEHLEEWAKLRQNAGCRN